MFVRMRMNFMMLEGDWDLGGTLEGGLRDGVIEGFRVAEFEVGGVGVFVGAAFDDAEVVEGCGAERVGESVLVLVEVAFVAAVDCSAGRCGLRALTRSSSMP